MAGSPRNRIFLKLCREFKICPCQAKYSDPLLPVTACALNFSSPSQQRSLLRAEPVLEGKLRQRQVVLFGQGFGVCHAWHVSRFPTADAGWPGHQQIHLRLVNCPRTPTAPHAPAPASAGTRLNVGARCQAPLLASAGANRENIIKNGLFRMGLQSNLLFAEKQLLFRRCLRNSQALRWLRIWKEGGHIIHEKMKSAIMVTFITILHLFLFHSEISRRRGLHLCVGLSVALLFALRVAPSHQPALFAVCNGEGAHSLQSWERHNQGR